MSRRDSLLSFARYPIVCSLCVAVGANDLAFSHLLTYVQLRGRRWRIRQSEGFHAVNMIELHDPRRILNAAVRTWPGLASLNHQAQRRIRLMRDHVS